MRGEELSGPDRAAPRLASRGDSPARFDSSVSPWRWTVKRNPNGYTVTCPYCRTKFVIGGYSPGLIRCGACGKAFNLK